MVNAWFNHRRFIHMSTSNSNPDNTQKGNDKSQRQSGSQQNQGGQHNPGGQDNTGSQQHQGGQRGQPGQQQGQRESGGQHSGAPNRDKTGDANRKEGSNK
jgi:hypothetical protein